jgi:hypothetical protein
MMRFKPGRRQRHRMNDIASRNTIGDAAMNRLPLAAAVALVLVMQSAFAAPPKPRIERVATLHGARSVHTATALPSGDVLIAGGMAAEGASLASAELIDASRDAVTPLPPMARARSAHTATRLADGRVVIAGGFEGDGGYLSSVEVYDPAKRRYDAMGDLSTGRSGHTATLLADGRILMAGGVGRGWTFLSSAELFDPATGRSVQVGSLSTPRESHTATLLVDGRVLVTGGHQGRRSQMEVYACAEIYDPAAKSFSAAGTLATPRHKHDAVRLADGRVLVIGGADRTDRRHFDTTEIWDPALRAFTPGPSMADTRYKIERTAVLLPTGEVLVPAGARTAELLDSGARAFRPVGGGFPSGFHFATSTLLDNGDVLIVGGYGDSIDSTPGVWRYHAQ